MQLDSKLEEQKPSSGTRGVASTPEIQMVVSEVRGDVFLKGLASSTDEARIIPYGSWEQWKILDTPMGNEVVHEARLSSVQAIVQAGKRSYPGIVSTSLGEESEQKLTKEFAAIQKFNSPVYDAVLPEAKLIRRLAVPQLDPLLEQAGFGQPTAITAEFLQARIEEGFGFSPDRNDARIAELLGNEQLLPTSIGLNNKNYFYKFLEQAETGLEYPKAHLFQLGNTRDLDMLLAKSNEELFAVFMGIAKKELPADTRQYFFKIALSAGGMGVTRLALENITELRTLLTELRARSLDGRSPDVQIVAGVPISKPNQDNPIDLENTSYFSPCLTLRIQDKNRFVLGQVADQVLKGGTAWAGAYWDRDKERDMLAQVGFDKVEKLGKQLGAIGYQGYFGTDFIRTESGEYALIVDGNARQNGNDSTCLLRKALTPRMDVQSMFLTLVPLAEEVSDQELGDAFQDYFGAFAFDKEAKAGMLLLPNYQAATLAGDANTRKVAAVYINPKADPDRFNTFFTSFI